MWIKQVIDAVVNIELTLLRNSAQKLTQLINIKVSIEFNKDEGHLLQIWYI
jgi:hypothetical protein